MAISNVALTDTFDTQRIRLNQDITRGNEQEITLPAAFGQANTAYTHANNAYSRANTAYTHANNALARANVSLVLTNRLPGAAGLLSGDEGIAIDFLTRTAIINDYNDVLSSSGRPNNLLTITRASTKMAVDRSRNLSSVATNTLAYDHDPVTGAPKGVLIEPAATNLMLRSEEMDSGTWTKAASSVAANSIAAPNGATTADTFIESATTAIHTMQQIVTITAGSVYTFSVWARLASGTRFLEMILDDGSANGSYAVFDLSSGSIALGATVRGTATGNAASITAFPDGWYRCQLSTTCGPSATSARALFVTTNGVTTFAPSYAGDGTSGIYLWGAQLETGSIATSYIPTTSGTVARSADMVSIASNLFPLNEAQGTLFVEGQIIGSANSTYPHFITLAGANENTDVIGVGWAPASSNNVFSTISVAGVLQYNEFIATPKNNGSLFKVITAYRSNNAISISDAVFSTEDTSVSLPTITRLLIGQPAGYQLQPALNIKRVAYISRRLTNAEIQSMTT